MGRRLDSVLADRRYLTGEPIAEADWRVFKMPEWAL